MIDPRITVAFSCSRHRQLGTPKEEVVKEYLDYAKYYEAWAKALRIEAAAWERGERS